MRKDVEGREASKTELSVATVAVAPTMPTLMQADEEQEEPAAVEVRKGAVLVELEEDRWTRGGQQEQGWDVEDEEEEEEDEGTSGVSIKSVRAMERAMADGTLVVVVVLAPIVETPKDGSELIADEIVDEVGGI